MCSRCHLSVKCGLASVSFLRLQTPSHWASTLHNAARRSNWKGRISLALQRCKACHAQQQLTSQQLRGSVQWQLPGWGWCPQGAFALSSPCLGCQRVAQAGRRQDPLAGFLALFMKGKVIFITFHLEGSYKSFIWCSLQSSCSALPRRKTSDWSLCFMPENLNK